jgi:tetratricopeptide (TPR) repeat protein
VLWGSVAGARPTAIGDAVNVARRLAESAEPGALLVSKAVERAVPRRFRFRELPALTLRGREETVLPYLAQSEHAVQTEFRAPEELAPLVGRDAELARLWKAFGAGQGACLVVEGAAGVGKSRLLAEFRARVRAAHPNAWVAVGRTADGLPFEPFAEIARAEAGASGMDRGDASRLVEALRAPLEHAGHTRLEAENLAHLVALSIGAPVGDARVRGIDPAHAEAETRRAWRSWLQARAGGRPAALCIEDLQAADAETLLLLEDLAAAPCGVALVASSRPGALVPRGFAPVPLDELPRDGAISLARAVLGRDLPPDLARTFLERTGGNPLYVEELARFLRDHGEAETRRVPEGLHGVLTARLDALDPEVKDVVKTAAVVGRTFWHLFLARLIGREVAPALDALHRLDMAFPQTGSLLENDGQYAFKHALLRDAAYALVPKKERARLHALAAGILEQLARHGGRQVKALAAAHHRDAGRPDDASRLWNDAAADAARDAAWTESLGWARSSLDARPSPAAHLLAGRALDKLGRYEEALAQADTAAGSMDDRSEAEILAARALYNLKRFDASIERADRVQASRPSPRWAAAARTARVHAMLAFGRFEESLAEALAGIAVMPADLPDHVRGALLETRGLALWRLGRHDEARASHEEVLELARGSGDRGGVSSALNNLATALQAAGRLDEALARHRESLAVNTECGDLRMIAMNHNNIANAFYLRERLPEALEECETAIRIRREIGETSGLASSLHNRGAMLHKSGRSDEALASIREALEFRRRLGDRAGIAASLSAIGEILSTLERPGASEPLKEAVSVCRSMNDRRALARVLFALGQQLATENLLKDARHALEEAIGLLQELGMTRLESQAREELNRLGTARSRPS